MCENVFVVPDYYSYKDKLKTKAGCTEAVDMHISDAGGPEPGSEPCRFPKLEECAHFHYERVQLPRLSVTIQTNMDQSLHSQHSHDDGEWHMVQVTSGDECWLLQRNLENFRMLDSQLHQCIYDRKISMLPDLSSDSSHCPETEEPEETTLSVFLNRFCEIADNSVNCGPVLNWLQMDNKGHRLLVPSEESRSINTPAVAAAYSVRRYVSQARDELNLEVGDMISVIDMASPGESIWWRGKRGFQVGFFPQHCVHIIGDKVPRNMPLPAPVVGSLALSPIKPVLRKHGKLIAFFRSFILNRPSRRRLKQSGILKERVFGCDLGEHLLNSGHEIPMVLKCCAEFIETHGIVDGIYRLSGVTSNIQKLRNAFDEDRIPNLYTEDILQDIHSVASLLKMYFRELPNPLCTYQLYQSFVNAVQGCKTSIQNSETDHERLLKMRESVQKLPPPHYRTLEYLMRHLARVAKHGHSTGMTTRNVAIVWAPNLLRCAELEVGGVAALQGVGVQAVVTEFLICYTDLIFCDNLPNLDRPMAEVAVASPKRCRPKSLAISTPTKLITLEEARSKHLLNKECSYIEVGGGPDSLPKKYHTIIDLPPGARKRGLSKRSPMGWRSFFSRNRNSSQGVLNKPRKASTPGIVIPEKAVTESDLTDIKRKLRSVKSAESLTSGHSEPASNDIDILGPLHCLNKPPGHNRSVSHDSYFDTLQSSHNNSEGSLLDLSEIQLNFELEESEMRIFSEDESLVSSPRIHKEAQRRILTRARPEEYLSATNSINPSPKKQARVVMSPDCLSRKRTRLEDQLSDIQFIDCSTPDNITVSTTAVIHVEEDITPIDMYQPKNKSPRSSEVFKRQSLNLEKTCSNSVVIPKSVTEGKLNRSTTPTPQSPIYKQLIDSSSTTPGDFSPSAEIIYQKLNKSPIKVPKSPNYENVLTTISITYKSPTKSFSSNKSDPPTYESRAESAQIPTSTANLPVQQAKCIDDDKRPKSLNDLDPKSTPTDIDTLFQNLKSTVENNSLTDLSLSEVLNSSSEYIDSNRTSVSLPLTPTRGTMSPNVSPNSLTISKNPSLEDTTQESSTSTSNQDDSFPKCDTNLSELYETYDEIARDYENSKVDLTCLETGGGTLKAFSCFDSGSSLGCLGGTTGALEAPDSKPNEVYEVVQFPPAGGYYDNVEFRKKSMNLEVDRPKSINLIEFSPMVEEVKSPNNEKRKQDDTIYQQVKYFRRSVHEINELLALGKDVEDEAQLDSLEDNRSLNVYENVDFSSDSLEMAKSNIEILEKDSNCQTDVAVSEELILDLNIAVKDTKTLNAVPVTNGENQNEINGVNTPEAVELVSVSNNLENVVQDESSEQSLDKVDVKSLTSKFEVVDSNAVKMRAPKQQADAEALKKSRDSLPPCLRARNLKNAIKTRSLDEEEFRKEFDSTHSLNRRKSFDETLTYKINSLPKSLNKPKKLPDENDDLKVHLAHSVESVKQNLNRERIEKYKEERRKFLNEKYRSESFKEDKDVLLSRIKVFKPKEEIVEAPPQPVPVTIPVLITQQEEKKFEEARRSFSKIENEEVLLRSPKRSSIRSKTAIFESKKNTDLGEVELRNKRRDVVDRHRHTFETRERDPKNDSDINNRRVSLDSKPPRKEKTSPSYCIKDMKAIFESKSHQ
ncbi:PREDICTED: GTPase-activating protein CdGAPr isoform X2 [Nicrophorus vespilloides]|uniref:GTPase-activating protein CdGAPr isoform X2 n=1 Tax=Nicrophorus vespilloides TaxID=110193 RepID=A0ABM1M973_NICVS|nr:PREDICTED: GTPase-activating protein CdGAPr isoform X2 [Nicrophorus vespilloides]